MQAGVLQLWSGVCVPTAGKRREGLMLPDELINSESKQIQVSTASPKPQRRVELKIAVYNKLPIDLFFYF